MLSRPRAFAALLFSLAACASGTSKPAGDAGTPAGDSGALAADGPTTVVDAGTPDAGCVEPTTCSLELGYPNAGETSVELRGSFAPDGWDVGVPLVAAGDRWAVTLERPNHSSIQYKFLIDGARWVADPANPTAVPDGFGGVNSVARVDCGGCAREVFDWRDGVMYFVLVDRFRNGDPVNDAPLGGVEDPANYAGGDLEGVRQAIDEGYFDTLGVNVLWLSSPLDNADGAGAGDDGHAYSGYHGYWPSDLERVESRIGDEELLRAVVAAAHARGIRVVLDYVMNHVHAESPTYAAHPEWFWPEAGCICGDGCSWDAEPDRLRCWFRSYLPDFDFTNEYARTFSVGNAVRWAQRAGVDGFRLDAIKHVETSWLTDLRQRLALEVEWGGQPFYLVGETYSGDRELIRAYVDPATKLDGQFDFPLRAQLARTLLARQGVMGDLDAFLATNDGYYGPGAVMSTFLGNHDLPRAIHLAEETPQFGEWDSGKSRAWSGQPTQPEGPRAYERLGVGFAALYTTPGIPVLYYGDEVGLAGAGDPDNRRPMPWGAVSADQERLRERLGRLAAARAAHPALRRGARRVLAVTADTYVFEATHDGDRVIVALNRGDSGAAAGGVPAGRYRDLVEDVPLVAPLSLAPRSALVLVAE
ncbi:MAG: hypothetical protein EXR73_02865 [Myxococcales bacterium]|nr:hypothetical protein [Myxococcales bacterium]